MKRYCTRIAVKPTTFTEDTAYQAWVNTDTKTVRLLRMHLQLDSADAGGTGNSVYGWQRIKGTPSATGADVIVPTRYDNNTEPSMMLCYRKNAGLTMTGVTRETYFLERSCVSKTTGSASNIEFDHEEGFLLLPGEGLCIFADNTVIDGSGVYGMLEWGEE
jgi:hypothetical protein